MNHNGLPDLYFFKGKRLNFRISDCQCEQPLGRQASQGAVPPPEQRALHRAPAPDRRKTCLRVVERPLVTVSLLDLVRHTGLGLRQVLCDFLPTKTAARINFALEEISAVRSLNIRSCAEAPQACRHHKSNSYNWWGRRQDKSKQNPRQLHVDVRVFIRNTSVF